MQEQNFIYLASQSPRRAELLQQIGVCFKCIEQNAAEIHQSHESSQDFVLRLAKDKALSGLQSVQKQHLKMAPILASDTIVVVDGQILGKPDNQQDALDMLAALSNRTHEVMTAIAVLELNTAGEQKLKTAVSISRVEFARISPEQALNYWNTGEPQDKAGSYAIQGLGALFVKSIQGSYSGVMGLPLYETADLLEQFSIHVLE